MTIIGTRDTLIAVRQVATLLSVSTATVYDLCERGAIRHRRVSNLIRFRLEDVQDSLVNT